MSNRTLSHHGIMLSDIEKRPTENESTQQDDKESQIDVSETDKNASNESFRSKPDQTGSKGTKKAPKRSSKEIQPMKETNTGTIGGVQMKLQTLGNF